MVIDIPPRLLFRKKDNQPDSSLLLSTLIQDTLCVRENVRLYNCCGLVTAVYFVFFRDYLGLYG